MSSAVSYLGLGANVGDVLETLTAAVFALDDLEGFAVEDVSAVYRTLPWPPPGEPGAVPQDDYRNLVVRGRTSLAPHQLLHDVLAIERAFGRDRAQEVRWGPRILDIDVLLVGDIELASDELTLPHPRMAERAFVLVPLAEVAPGLVLPDGRRLTRLLADLAPIEGIDLDIRLPEVPTRAIPRPEGPSSPPPSLHRPGVDPSPEGPERS